MAITNYYYDNQVKRYLTQFMSIFSGMQAEVGKRNGEDNKLISVPVHYGNKDRVVAHIIADNTQNKPLRLPVMSVNLTSINMAPEMRKAIGGTRRQSYLPRGEVFPDGIKTVHQLMPVPYRAITELAIYTSNSEQRFQILEQILMLFDPSITIQTSDGVFDWTKLTTVTLGSITFNDNYPIGTDRRMLVTTLSFDFPIWIAAPANIKDDYIRDIYVRIGAVSEVGQTSDDIIAQLDEQGINYELWNSADDIILP